MIKGSFKGNGEEERGMGLEVKWRKKDDGFFYPNQDVERSKKKTE